MTQATPRTLVVQQLLGLLVVLLSLMVLVAWYEGWDVLMQFAPGVRPMPQRTAICTALAGAGVLLLAARQYRAAGAVGALVTAAGIVTQILQVGLRKPRLDDWLSATMVDAAPIAPGTMAELTAAACWIVGLALLFAAAARDATRWRVASAGCAVVVGVIAIIATLGYLVGLHRTYDWSSGAWPSPPSTLAFAALAVALLLHALRLTPARPPALWNWMPLVAATSLVSIVVLIGVSGFGLQQDAARFRRRTGDLLLETRLLTNAIADLQRGSRGFVLTGDVASRATFDAGRVAAESSLERLRGLSRDDAVMASLLAPLEPAIAAAVRDGRQLMQSRERVGLAGAAALESDGAGRRRAAALFALIGRADALADLRLVRSERIVQDSSRGLGLLQLCGGVLAILLLLGANRAAFIELRRRREAEAERQRQAASLEVSEERFRRAFEDAPIGMALVSPQGRWLRVNRALCHMVGYEEEALLQTDFQAITHPDDLETDLASVQRVLEGSLTGYQMEKRYLHRDGQWVVVLLSVSLVRDAGGVPLYFVSQIEDITARREVERLKDEFVAVVSHELRTPLTAIRGSVAVLEDGLAGRLPEAAQPILAIARQNGERLGRLIDDLLDVERIDSGRLLLQAEVLDVTAVIRESIDSIGPYAAGYRVGFELAPVQPALTVLADRDRLLQVLANLLSNAVKVSAPDTRVAVSATADVAGVHIAVRDRGAGIPEAFRARIFHRFAQADGSPSRPVAGSGLGLYISRQLVEAMGGTIDFETSADGTTFRVVLPGPG